MSIEGDMYADELVYKRKKALEETGVLVLASELRRAIEVCKAAQTLSGDFYGTSGKFDFIGSLERQLAIFDYERKKGQHGQN